MLTASPFKLRFLRLLCRLLVMGLLLVAGFYLYCTSVLFLLRAVNPPTTMVQVQRRIEALVRNRPYTKQYDFMPLSQMSINIRHAVVAAEDTRFYQHHGVDWQEMRKMLDRFLRGEGSLRGVSTITQQVVKNQFFTTRRSIVRKGFELTLAPLTEAILTKRRILEIYLNIVEWGPGIYGIQAAAEHYYGIPASRLSRMQAARLAAILPAPLTRHPDRMDDYSREILRRMTARGW